MKKTETKNSGVKKALKVIGNILQKFQKVQPRWEAFIDQSFLPEELRERYKAEISQRLAVLTAI